MKTSRVARETAIIAANTAISTGRQTRSSLTASIRAFAAENTVNFAVKQEEEVNDDSSSLSSLSSPGVSDIEDALVSLAPGKRKRGIDDLAKTAVTTAPALARVPPCGTTFKSEDGSPAKIKKGRKQPAKKVVTETGEVAIHPPANWEEIYAAVQEMRKQVLAPVDTMGCESLAEDHRTPQDQRFQTLIALMLSSQTKDTSTALAIRRLQTSLPPPGLTLSNILSVAPATLNALIHPVGFHNNKTKYIKATAALLVEKFDSDIPTTAEALMSLPGVGPKMAYLCMSAAWGRTEGIGVDVHVHRITNLWGWHKTREPEETRKALQAWLPREKWHEINHLLVGFGQTICLPVGTKCGECVLSTKGLCPGAVAQKTTGVVKRKRKREVGEESGEVKEEEVDVVVKQEVEDVVTKDEDSRTGEML
ncbi:MAG: hypothetical protein LQ344_000923 [Seirophora lacunosa]|nr:MAG: hypothetical protein LQ344_000923 [Seirophora lacunosa]